MFQGALCTLIGIIILVVDHYNVVVLVTFLGKNILDEYEDVYAGNIYWHHGHTEIRYSENNIYSKPSAFSFSIFELYFSSISG